MGGPLLCQFIRCNFFMRMTYDVYNFIVDKSYRASNSHTNAWICGFATHGTTFFLFIVNRECIEEARETHESIVNLYAANDLDEKSTEIYFSLE